MFLRNARRRRPSSTVATDGYNGVRVGEAYHCGPLRVQVRIAQIQIDALVDTGSDYDAVDFGLSPHVRTLELH